MKLELDTTTQTITLKEEVNLGELFDYLAELEFNLDDWNLKQEYYLSPPTIFHNIDPEFYKPFGNSDNTGNPIKFITTTTNISTKNNCNLVYL